MRTKCLLTPPLLTATAVLAIYTLGVPSLQAQTGQAPGGFIVPSSDTSSRGQLTQAQVAAFVPTARGPFTFPAPWGAQAWRITDDSDCTGDCVNFGYSIWYRLNNSQGQNLIRVLVPLRRDRGGGGPTLYTINKTTNVVTKVGPLFSSSDARSYLNCEDCSWSLSDPDRLYLPINRSVLQRYNVVTGAAETVFDVNAPAGVALWGAGRQYFPFGGASRDDNVVAVTINDVNANWIGCGVRVISTNTYKYYPSRSGVGQDFQGCLVSKSGNYVVMADITGPGGTHQNRIIRIADNAEISACTEVPNGGLCTAQAHMDTGWDHYISADRWGMSQRFQLYDMAANPAGPRTTIIQDSAGGSFQTINNVSFANAQGGNVADSFAIYSQANILLGCARCNELQAARNDGSRNILVFAPVMTDPNTGGGGDPYGRQPFATIDGSGQYVYYHANLMGGPRLHAFVVWVPSQLLFGGTPSGDTTPPTVSMTAPANGATVAGSVTVSANASDNVGVVGVQFLVDGVSVGVEDTTAPYSLAWLSTVVPNGAHTISARARDAAGNTATAAAVTVTVQNAAPGDTTPPTVSMTAPANGATVSGTVTVSASASDNVGVVGVQFLVNGASAGAEDTTAPYSLAWNSTSVANGTHTISARARDAAGNTTTAAAVTVTVQNGTPGDTTPPSVSMTAPANGATVSGTVTLSASAADNVGVVGVQFRLDGLNLGPELTAAPYSMQWNSAGASAGGHTLTATARDAAGNAATSSPVGITVQNVDAGTDTVPPSVTMTSPQSGATVSGSIVVSANAQDNVGVARVQFLLDGAPLGAPLLAPPYAMAWDTATATAGGHTLTAVASDAAGNTATASVSFGTREARNGAAPRGSVERVAWTNVVNATVYLWRLRKTSGCDSCADAGALSSQRILSGDGYVEFTASKSDKVYYVGFGPDSPGTSPLDLDYGVRLNGQRADVYEANVPKASEPARDGDIIRISILGGIVTYTRNGTVFHTSQRPPLFPLAVRAVLMDRRAEVSRAYFWRPAAAASSVSAGALADLEHGPGRRDVPFARLNVDGLPPTGAVARQPRNQDDEPRVRPREIEFDRAIADVSMVAEWALGLAAEAGPNVTAVYLYARPVDGSSDTALFLGAISPEHVGQSAEASRLARERIGRVLATFPLGPYTIAAFAQASSGVPYELGTATVVIR